MGCYLVGRQAREALRAAPEEEMKKRAPAPSPTQDPDDVIRERIRNVWRQLNGLDVHGGKKGLVVGCPVCQRKV